MTRRSLKERLLLDSKNPDERSERRYYTIGLVLSVLLTIGSFGSVMTGLLPRGWAIPMLIVLALTQITVHFRIFLHISFRQRREDLQLLLFTLLLLGIMALGTLWVLGDLNARMM